MSGTIEELIGKERMKGISPVIKPKGSEVVYPSEPKTKTLGGIPEDYTQFPTSIESWWEKSILTPIVSPIGLFKAPAKTIIKYGGIGLGAIGGFILASLFGGGQEQQQEQDIAQTPTVTPIVTPIVIPTITPTVTPAVTPTLRDILDSIIYGDVQSPVTTTITPTYTYTKTTTITPTKTITYAQQDQQQKAEQGIGLLEIAILGGALLGGAYLFGGKRT